jgi:hypothetical protein
MPEGEFTAQRRNPDTGILLVFDADRGLLVHHGPAGLRRAAFPHRPGFVADSGAVAVYPWPYLATQGLLRQDAFELLRLFLATGELPNATERPACEQPLLPDMAGFAPSPEELRRIDWVSADVV